MAKADGWVALEGQIVMAKKEAISLTQSMSRGKHDDSNCEAWNNQFN
jgi:hypothetical protein